MPASNQGGNSYLVTVAIIVAPIASFCGVLFVIWSLFWRKLKAKGQNEEGGCNNTADVDLPLLKFATVVNATDNFSMNKKLGVRRWFWTCVQGSAGKWTKCCCEEAITELRTRSE